MRHRIFWLYSLDKREPEPWFCVRCEQETKAVRRINTIGASFIGLLPAVIFGMTAMLGAVRKRLEVPELPALSYPVLGTAIAFAVWACVMGAILVDAGRSLLCSTCMSPEVVPRDSKRAKRLLAEQTAVAPAAE